MSASLENRIAFAIGILLLMMSSELILADTLLDSPVIIQRQSNGNGALIELDGKKGFPTWYNEIFQDRVRWFHDGFERAIISDNTLSPDNNPPTILGNNKSTFIAPSIMGNGIFPVTSFGAVANDGITDCTQAFQNALQTAANYGGGTVIVPPGEYIIRNVLFIPAGVTLKGSWENGHTDSYGWMTLPPQPKRGSILLSFSGRNNIDGTPFITMEHNSCIAGITIRYPEQTVTDMKPYPWTIFCFGSPGEAQSIVNVNLVNSYQGIECRSMPYIRNVNMCALRKGIEIDSCYESGRIENVHISPVCWFPYITTEDDFHIIRDSTLANLEGFVFKRVDWAYISNCFVIWANSGFHFMPTQNDDDPSATVLMSNSGTDNCAYAMKIEDATPWWGASFQNCLFTGKTEISANTAGGAPIKFSNCAFWPTLDTELPVEFHTTTELINKTGNSIVHLSNCSFPGRSTQQYLGDYIKLSGGTLMATNCGFGPIVTGKYHLRIETTTPSVSIIGCSAQTALNIYKCPGFPDTTAGRYYVSQNLIYGN
jgi:hypothetical protein